MDSLYATPLLDLFKRGEVAHDIRMLAAQGVLAPRVQEQLALLVLLSRDADPGIKAAADATVAKIPPSALARFLGRPDVPDDIRQFFAARGIEGVPEAAAVDDEALAGELPGAAAGLDDLDGDQAATLLPEADDDQKRMATVQRLSIASVTEKVKAAMRGTREERGILIRDPNKLVSIAVLSSPKLTAQEVETFVKMGSVSEEALRVIGTTRAWVKSYSIIKGLCFNPKTPVGLSLGFVKRLLERDIKAICTDRSLPDPIKLAARKILQAGASRRN
jgi:hypothetical protein